jgi:DNA polymerase-3 subunit delta
VAVSGAVHAIVGADSFLAEEALERILAGAGADREGVQVMRGDETSWPRLVDNVGMGSLFADRRAVVVRKADALKGDGEEMVAYLDDPTPGVTLVLLIEKADKRLKVWKRLLERAQVTPAEPLKGRALRSFLLERLRARKLRLADEAVEELLDHFGQDLRRLMGEIDKLEAFAEGGRVLSADDVSAVAGRGKAQPFYKLGDALAARRVGPALDHLRGLLEEGEAAQKILAALHRSLRQVRGARVLQQRRAGREEVISRLGLLPFKAGDVLEAARRWSEEDLRRAFLALGEADRRMKTGVDPKVAMVAAVAEACAAGSSGRPAADRLLGSGRPRPLPRPGR